LATQLGFGFGKGRRVIAPITARAPRRRTLAGLKGLALVQAELAKRRRMAKADLEAESR